MIVVDVQALQSPAYATRGIGRFVADLATTLTQQHPDTVDAWAWNDRLAQGPQLEALDRSLGLDQRLRSFSSLRGCDVDVLHLPAPFAALGRAPAELVDFLDTAVPVRARRLVATLHDLIPWRFPERYLADPTDRARYHNRLALLLAADCVLTDSTATADDAVELLGLDRRRVVVAGAGVNPRFHPADDSREARLARLRTVMPTLGEAFVMVPAPPDWRKNLDGALAAYAHLPQRLRQEHQLVVAAGLDQPHLDQLWADASRLGIEQQVLAPGFLDDDLIADLYRSADLVVVPSRYEGFGLPVIEARACGARVICSDVSSLPEVLPDARARFDPEDVPAMAALIEQALVDDEFRAVLDAVPSAPYSWSATAEAVVAAYRRQLVSASARTRRERRRLAVATVLPPTDSGVADHSEHLIDALAELDDLDVVVFTTSSPRRMRRSPRVTVRHLAAMPERWLSGEFDQVVYCLGNQVVHRPFYDMLRAVPGHVLLHDVRLARLYGPAGPADRNHDSTAADEHLAAPIASLARSVLVQSNHAATLVEAVAGRSAVDIGPHPCWNDGRSDRLDDGGAPWVVSAGIAHELKRTDLFVEAMRIVKDRMPVRAAIVGDGGPRFVGEGDEIVTTGRVSDAEFDEWLRRSAILVQLRATTNGESSGVVAHAMARGVPLVVTDIGAMSEIPDAIAVRVDPEAGPEVLADAVSGLLSSPSQLESRRAAGLAFAADHTAKDQARLLVDAVFATACEDEPVMTHTVGEG